MLKIVLGVLGFYIVYGIVRYLVIPFYARSAANAGLISPPVSRAIVDWAQERMSAEEMEHEAQGSVSEERRSQLLEMALNRYQERGDRGAAASIRAFLAAQRFCSSNDLDAADQSLRLAQGRLGTLEHGLKSRILKCRLINELIESDGIEGVRRWMEQVILHNLPECLSYWSGGHVREDRLVQVRTGDDVSLREFALALFVKSGSFVEMELAIDTARQRCGVIPSRDELLRGWIATQSSQGLTDKVTIACDRWQDLDLPLEVACGGEVRNRWVTAASQADVAAARQSASEFFGRVPTAHRLRNMFKKLDEAGVGTKSTEKSGSLTSEHTKTAQGPSPALPARQEQIAAEESLEAYLARRDFERTHWLE